MPSGKIHNAVTILTSFYLGMGVGYTTIFGVTSNEALAMPLGCLVGLLISPDLDIDNGNISDATIRTRLGCLPALVWRLYWTPYARLLPHRSWLSHLPVLSTAIRTLYAFWWLPIFWPAGLTEPVLWYAILGLMIADWHHIFLDWWV